MRRSSDEAWAWTRYWQGGREEGPLAETLGLLAHWRDYFSAFPAGARLLELGTGSGHVAQLAARVAQDLDRSFRLEATDAARLPPALIAHLAARGIRARGEVYASALAFEDGSYDGVFSQFGIEYGERPAAFREAARVLRPGGHGLFIMHHAGGTLTAACARRLSVHKAVIGDLRCFAAGERVFAGHLRRAPARQLFQAEAQFRDEVAQLRRRLGNPPVDPNLVGLAAFLTDLAVQPARYDPADALRRLRFAEEDIESWRLRQQAQQAAALGPDEVGAVTGWLAEAGLEAETTEASRNGETIAWMLHVRRPAPAQHEPPRRLAEPDTIGS